MARRDANLAGLAALGALGYKLANSGKTGTRAPVEDRVGTPVLTGDDQYNADVTQYMDDTYNPDVKQYMDDTINPDVKQRKPAAKSAPSKPSAPVMMSRDEEAKIRAGIPRGRYSAIAAPKQTIGKTYPYNPARLKDEDASVETFTMKKGGKVKKMASGGMAKADKSAAKGWGQARGARGAKYY